MRTASYVSDLDIDQKTATWLKEIRAGVAPRPNLVLRPENAALLVVDMVAYFADPSGRAYLPATAAILPKIQAILTAWRARSGTVIFTRHGHEGAYDLGMLGKFFSDHIALGEPESEIVSGLAPVAGETVIPKKTYDAFWNTPLQSILEERGVSQLLITGVLTHMCCETTARSAFCRGFEVYIPADATAANSEAHHLGSLSGLADSVAVVLGTAEVLARC
jgi:bifunctional isochorismate lyase/aryl carrier protein